MLLKLLNLPRWAWLLVAVVVVFGAGAYAGWRLRPPEQVGKVEPGKVPPINVTIRQEQPPAIIYLPGQPRPVYVGLPPVVVSQPSPGRVETRVERQVVTQYVDRLKLQYPQAIDVQLGPTVTVILNGSPQQAQLAGTEADRRVTLALTSKPGEPPVYTPFVLPTASLTVDSVTTTTKFIVAPPKVWTFRLGIGAVAPFGPVAHSVQPYLFAEAERRLGQWGPFEGFCRGRVEYGFGQSWAGRVECGAAW